MRQTRNKIHVIELTLNIKQTKGEEVNLSLYLTN
jgi:hypothetical protein